MVRRLTPSTFAASCALRPSLYMSLRAFTAISGEDQVALELGDLPKNVHRELARRPLRAHTDRAEMNAALLELGQPDFVSRLKNGRRRAQLERKAPATVIAVGSNPTQNRKRRSPPSLRYGEQTSRTRLS